MRGLGGLIYRISANTSDFEKKLAGSEKRVLALGNRLGQAGRTMTLGITAPMMAIAGGALMVAAGYERSMNRVQALSGATGAQFVSLQKQARQLGATTQFSASDAADGMGFLAMAGFKTNQILGAMPSTLQLAAAAQMDLAQAADITSNILTGYGLEVDQLGRANDVLVKSFTSANTDLAQLGEAFKYAGPVARGAGLSFEEAAAALSMMGNAGIQGSMAGTSLRGALTRLMNPTREVSNTLRRLRVNVHDANGQLIPFDEIIRRLEPHAEDTAAMMQIFGQRAGPAMAALLGQGSTALETFVSQLKESEGTAERIADSQMKGLSGALKELRSAVEELALATTEGGPLSGMTWFVKRLADLARGLSTVHPLVINVALGLGGLVGILGPAAVAIAAVSKAVMFLKGAAALGGLAGMLATGGPILLGLGALAAVFLTIAGNAKKGEESISQFQTTLAGMDKGGLSRLADSNRQRLREIDASIAAEEAAIAESRSRLEEMEAGYQKELLRGEIQLAEQRIARARSTKTRLLAEHRETLLALRSVSTTPPRVNGNGDGDGDGGALLTAMQQRMKVLHGLYEGLRSRGEDVSAVLREMTLLHVQIEAAIRREGSALSETRAEAIKLAATLRDSIFGGVRPEVTIGGSGDALENISAAQAARRGESWSGARGRMFSPVLAQRAEASMRTSLPSPLSGTRRAGDRGSLLAESSRSSIDWRGSIGAAFRGPQAEGKSVSLRDRGMLTLVSGAERAGQALRGLPKGLAGIGGQLISVFNPLTIMSRLLGGAFEAMAPTIEALEQPVKIVGEVFGKALAPVLKALFPVFKWVAIAATYVGEIFFTVAGGILNAIGWLINSIGKLINKIPGVSGRGLINFGQSMIDMGDGFKEGAKALAAGRDEIRAIEWTEKLGDAAKQASYNVSEAFNENLRRHQVSTGAFQGRGGGVHTLVSGGSAVESSMVIENVNIYAAPGDDGVALFEKFQAELRERRRREEITELDLVGNT